MFSLDPSPTLHVVTIKPEEVTQLWAGVFLVHAVSQLADRVLGATPRDATPDQVLLSDFRAYELELTAADLLAKGALRVALDSLLDQARPLSTEHLASQVSPIAVANRALLNGVFPGGEPKSHAEVTLRAGFLAMALLVRHAERHDLPPDSILAAIDYVQRSAPLR
jgi:hypothetical protein